MAASSKSHADQGLEVEIIVGSYEHVLFGYKLVDSDDAAQLNLSFTDKSHCASVRTVAVSANKLLASGSADETIQLFDLKSRQEAGTLIKHSGTVTHLEFFDDFIISSDDSGIICIWKILGKSYECMKTLSGHKGSVLSMSVHPSGKLLLTVGQDKTLRTWNLVTAKRAYTTNVKSIVDILRWSPDGEKYVLCYNRQLDVCSLAKAAPEHTVSLPGKGHALAFVSSRILAVGCEGGSVVFVDIDTGTLITDFKVECNRIKSLATKALTDNKCLLSFVTNEGLVELHLVDVETNSVATNLIAATKTVLRPICMELVIKSDNALEQDSSSKAEAKAPSEDVQKKKPGKRRRQDSPADDDQQPFEKAQTSSEKEGTQKQMKAKVGSKKSKGKDSTTLEYSKTTSEKKQQSNPKKMDRLKKVFSGKSKADQSDDGDQKVKKPMRPVDSVKITKQKFSDKKKQQRAKHHHIVEEAEATTT